MLPHNQLGLVLDQPALMTKLSLSSYYSWWDDWTTPTLGILVNEALKAYLKKEQKFWLVFENPLTL